MRGEDTKIAKVIADVKGYPKICVTWDVIVF